jgi:hypothetical protein
MFNALKTAAIAGLIGLTALAAVPAKADSLYLGFGDRRDDTRFGIYLGDNGRAYHPRERYRERDRRCTPQRALYKAERMGIRRARIADVGRRQISVVGRSRGDRVYVTFARVRGCPVIG